MGLVFREEEEKLGLPRRGEEELVEWVVVLALKPMDWDGLAGSWGSGFRQTV